MPPIKGIVTFHGLQFRTLTLGERGKPLMLFLHGFPDSADMWEYLMESFSRDYFCVAYNQRGYDGSSAPPDVRDYHLDALSSDVQSMIETQGYEKAIIVAHDWGGIVAYYLAGKFPECIEKLIICNAPHPLVLLKLSDSSFVQFFKALYVRFFQIPVIPEWCLTAGNFWLLRIGMKCTSKTHRFDPIVMDHSLNIWKRSSFRGMLNWYRNLYRIPRQEKETSVPVLLLWAEKDHFLSLRIPQENKKLFPNTTIKIFPDTGHWMLREFPETIRQSIAEFL